MDRKEMIRSRVYKQLLEEQKTKNKMTKRITVSLAIMILVITPIKLKEVGVTNTADNLAYIEYLYENIETETIDISDYAKSSDVYSEFFVLDESVSSK